MFLFAEMEHGNLLNVLLDFKSNFINWLLLVGVISWLCIKYLPPIFAARKKSIESALDAAFQVRQEAFTFLEDQKTKVTGLEKEAEKLLEEARLIAEEMRNQIKDETRKDIADMKQKFENAIVNEQRVSVTETRAVAIRVAISLTETYLKEHISDTTQNRLLNQFVEQLDTVNGEEQPYITGRLQSIHNMQ